jgi:hypothetical protein
MLNTTKGGTGFPYAHVKYYLKNPIIFVIFPKTKRALRQKWLFSCSLFTLSAYFIFKISIVSKIIGDKKKLSKYLYSVWDRKNQI